MADKARWFSQDPFLDPIDLLNLEDYFTDEGEDVPHVKYEIKDEED